MTKLHMTNLARMDDEIDADRLQALRRRYHAGWFMRYLILPFFMSIMLTALMAGILSVVVEVSMDGRWHRLTFLLFFIALEAIYTTNWISHPRQMPLDRVAYRGAELLLLLIIARIASWFIFGGGIPNRDVLLKFLYAPQALVLDSRFLITVLLAAIIWRLGVLLSKIFTKLQISEFELRFHSLPLAQRKARVEDQPIQANRGELVETYIRLWLLGGLLLVIATALSTFDQQSVAAIMAPLASGHANLEPRLLGALLLYFIIGLWLLSQARLMHVHARWLLNNIDTDDHSRQKWQRTSLLILGIVIIVATFLPIGSTSTISHLINILLYWALAIVNFIIFLLVLPFAFLLALLSGQELDEVTPPPPIEPNFTQPPFESSASTIGETLSMVLSSGFWAVLIVIVILALLFYLRERRLSSRGQIKHLQLGALLLAWLRKFWDSLHGQVQSLQDTLLIFLEPESSTEETRGKRSRWRFLRVNNLSPRDQLRYFYLSTVRRASDQGVNRQPSGTPSEYSEELKESWPEAERGLEDLTKAFLKARYSGKEISTEDIPPIKGTWKEVRRELNQKPALSDENIENKEER